MKKNQSFDEIISREVARLLISIKAVTFRFDPPFTYTSGLKSPMYLDNRLVMSYPEIREKIIGYYIQVIREKIGLDKVDWISATATAAIPHGSFVADKLSLPMVYVRPSTKTYGKGGKVEGFLKKGSRVIIIEDHISTAESVYNNTQAIRELGGIVKYCIATTTYETKKSKEMLDKSRIILYCLTTGKIILSTAQKLGFLTQKQKASADLWFADPVNWIQKTASTNLQH